MLKLLIVKTSSLGDVIHCLPVIADIHAHFPNAQIDWVVEESFADIPRLHSGVKNVFTVAVRRWKKAIFSRKTWTEIAAFKKLINQNQYDAIVDCQGLLKSALITKQANGVKHGYDKNSIREPLASWFYDKTYTISYNQHAVTRNRALAAMSLSYSVPETAPNYGVSSEKTQMNSSVSRIDIGLQSIVLNEKFIIALHGTSRDSKLWPIENWVALGKMLTQQNLNLVLPWANAAEFKRANEIANQLDNATILPKLSIAELASVISKAKAAIGVDTGLSHLAASLDIPTIAIYTDTNPMLTGVLAGAKTPAINLGDVGKIPNVDEVFVALKKISPIFTPLHL